MIAKLARERLIWPFQAWPSMDRDAWMRGCSKDDPYADHCRGAGLRPASLARYRKAYGRWLSFLHAMGWLDEQQLPLERVTRRRLRGYFRKLKAAGNADFTIISQFAGLACAIGIICPHADTAWIRRPDGVSIYALLPKKRRPKVAPDSAVMFTSGLQIMDQFRDRTSEQYQPVRYRDGLMLAMFAGRGRRLGSMECLRLGYEIRREGVVYRVVLSEPQTKTGVRDHFNLPEALTPYIDHYIAAILPALLQGQSTAAFWVNQHGRPLGQTAIYKQFHRLTKALFGYGFGPHRCRHALVTTNVLRAPEDPELALEVLGISGQVMERHYRMAGQSVAIANLAALNRSTPRPAREKTIVPVPQYGRDRHLRRRSW
jgi:hypothetical protein